MKPMQSPNSSKWLLVLVVGITVVNTLASAEECPVTTPSDSPIYLEGANNRVWYGTEQLAARIPIGGVWYGMGPDRDYGDKFWWWRQDYDAATEPNPDLRIVGTRIGDPNSKFEVDGATNALDPFGFGDAMLIGLSFPSAGCWQIRGTYNQSEYLEFTLQVSTNAA